jgi:hypothetical protein
MKVLKLRKVIREEIPAHLGCFILGQQYSHLFFGALCHFNLESLEEIKCSSIDETRLQDGYINMI